MSITSISNSGTYGKKSASIRESKENIFTCKQPIPNTIPSRRWRRRWAVGGGHGSDQRGGGGGGGGFRNSTIGEETGYPLTTPEEQFVATTRNNLRY